MHLARALLAVIVITSSPRALAWDNGNGKSQGKGSEGAWHGGAPGNSRWAHDKQGGGGGRWQGGEEGRGGGWNRGGGDGRGGGWDRGGSDDGNGRSGSGLASYRDNPLYLEALAAIQLLNAAMKEAGVNPLDDSRREKVREAKSDVDAKMEQLCREADSGALSATDLQSAKQELAATIDVEAPLREYAGGVKPDEESAKGAKDTGKISFADQGAAVAVATTSGGGAAASASASALAVSAPSVSVQVSVSGGSPGTRSVLESAGAAPTVLRTGVSPAPGVDTDRALNRMDTLLGELPPTAPGREIRRGRSIASTSDANDAPSAPLARVVAERPTDAGSPERRDAGTLALPRRNDAGTLRLESLTAAVADLKPGDVIGNIIPDGKDGFLHVTGDFSGGRLIAGNFGDGIAGVHLRKTAHGFTIEKLTSGELALAYLKLAMVWLAIGIPLFYACFILGVRIARRGEIPVSDRRAA